MTGTEGFSLKQHIDLTLHSNHDKRLTRHRAPVPCHQPADLHPPTEPERVWESRWRESFQYGGQSRDNAFMVSQMLLQRPNEVTLEPAATT